MSIFFEFLPLIIPSIGQTAKYEAIENAFEMKSEYNFSKGVIVKFYSLHKRPTIICLDDDIILYLEKMA